MSSILKKVGTIRLSKDLAVENVVHFGKPNFIRVSENGSNDNFNAYDLFVEEESDNSKKTK